MTKSTLHKKKVIPLAVVLTLLILGIFNFNSVGAISWPGDGAIFVPDDDHPTQYGVYIPQPNMYTTLSVDASNQGNFSIMDWEGTPWFNELVDYPGEDISDLYPWYFEAYWKNSITSDNLINPWIIDWINMTTLNPYDIELSNYTVNSIFNYYVMAENGMLKIPLNSTIPMQIDIMINSKGPKILKLDWLNEDEPMGLDPLGGNWDLISPSGKIINAYKASATYTDLTTLLYDRELFDYITFVANEIGTYRLLMRASYVDPTHLSLEFLDTPTSTLSSDSLEFIDNVDATPHLVEILDTDWHNKWYRINGEKGDLYRLNIGIDYETDLPPTISSWIPCENGYVMDGLMGASVYDLYFPTTGTAYLSFIDEDHGDAYRYSLYLEDFDILNYTIGYEPFITKISRDQRKAIEFEVQQDSFVRFNYTFYEQPLGDPIIYADGIMNRFLYEDSNSINCFSTIAPIETKVVGSTTFYYYFMPAGNYKALLRNTDILYEGVVGISSNYVNYLNDTLPITSLNYPDMYPNQFLTINFNPDAYYNGLHESQVVDLEISETGLYFLNTTIYASDHLAGMPLEANPLKVVTYNSSADTYLDVTDLALDPSMNFSAFSTDNPSNTYNDRIYIAYSSKWHDLHFNFSTPGASAGTPDIDAFFWNGAFWDQNDISNDWSDPAGTAAFTKNGTILIPSLTASYYTQWTMGADFDLPDIDEDQYYWMAIDHDNVGSDPYTQLPYIQTIKLSNITLQGYINLKIIRDSGYNYSDYWNPNPTMTGPQLLINQEIGNENSSDLTMLYAPNVLEAGTYKLLITPHLFGYSGPLSIDFGVIDFSPYYHQQSYNITEEPNLYPYQINNYNDSWYGPDNITTYSYGLTTTYNHTENVMQLPFGPTNLFVLECYGKPYMWTQLVLSNTNITGYMLYMLQDLPWSWGAPNELFPINPGTLGNATYEFGVLTDHFYLIFQTTAVVDMVTFRFDLTQYDTTILTTSIPIASYRAPSPGLSGPLVLGLVIGIPVAAGVIVVIYVLKKKGRIFSKTP